MSAATDLVARNLRRFRGERGMSLGELARRAGLAKQTLSNLEAGTANPTVDTLAAVAAALGLGVRSLVTEWGSPVLVRRADQAEWLDRAGDGMLVRDLDVTHGTGEVRTALLRWDAAPARPGVVPAHGPGTLHHLYVLAGRLRCGLPEDPVDLGPGDFIQFPADVAHWTAPLADGSLAQVTTTIPRLSQFS